MADLILHNMEILGHMFCFVFTRPTSSNMFCVFYKHCLFEISLHTSPKEKAEYLVLKHTEACVCVCIYKDFTRHYIIISLMCSDMSREQK